MAMMPKERIEAVLVENGIDLEEGVTVIDDHYIALGVWHDNRLDLSRTVALANRIQKLLGDDWKLPSEACELGCSLTRTKTGE